MFENIKVTILDFIAFLCGQNADEFKEQEGQDRRKNKRTVPLKKTVGDFQRWNETDWFSFKK